MKKFIALLVAVMMLVAMCATASAATKVSIWHTFTDAPQAALEKFAADFNATQTEYEVVVESQAYSGFLDSVYNAVANGVGPSIIINYASTAADYVEDGLVVDLSQYIFDEEIGMADVYNSLPDEEIDYESEVIVHTDGRTYTVPAGTQIRLTPGESIHVQQLLYHDFAVEEGTGPVLLGEVSQCNDDNTDNRFNPPVGRFPTIEEDEPPYRLLCNEYPKAK